MTTNRDGMTRSQWIGTAVFIFAIACTAVLVTYNATGTPLPKWILALATVL